MNLQSSQMSSLKVSDHPRLENPHQCFYSAAFIPAGGEPAVSGPDVQKPGVKVPRPRALCAAAG